MQQNKLSEYLTIILSCDPLNCRYSDCPLYCAEERACKANRKIDLISWTLKEKFKNTKML